MTPATKAPPRPRTSAARNAGRRARDAAHRRVARPSGHIAGCRGRRGPPRDCAGGHGPRDRDCRFPSLRWARSACACCARDARCRTRRCSTAWCAGGAGSLLLGVLLIGLVALNVSLLKLNAAAGHNAERAKELRIQNAKLRGKVSRLARATACSAAAAEHGARDARAARRSTT